MKTRPLDLCLSRSRARPKMKTRHWPVPVAQSSPTEDENPATEPAAMSPSSPTEEENPTTEPSPTNVEGTVSGTVLAFTEDEMLVLKTAADDPMNFLLSNTAYLDGAGNETATPMIQEGTQGTGDVQPEWRSNGRQSCRSRGIAFRQACAHAGARDGFSDCEGTGARPTLFSRGEPARDRHQQETK